MPDTELLSPNGAADQARDTAVAHVVDALTAEGFSITDLPTSAHGGAAEIIFAKLIPRERIILGDLIAKAVGYTDGSWPHWLDRSLENAENGDNIANAREELAKALAAAEHAVREVTRIHYRLTGPLYDVEHAEDNGLFTHYLTAAELAIRTAAAVNPTRP